MGLISRVSSRTYRVKKRTKMSAEVEDMFKRIMGHKGVKGLIIINSDGIAIKTNLDNATTVHYAALIHGLFLKTKSTIKEINPSDNLEQIRLRSFKHEILVAPSPEYLLICIQ